jgi:hypothetical protein
MGPDGQAGMADDLAADIAVDVTVVGRVMMTDPRAPCRGVARRWPGAALGQPGPADVDQGRIEHHRRRGHVNRRTIAASGPRSWSSRSSSATASRTMRPRSTAMSNSARSRSLACSTSSSSCSVR